MAGSEPSRRLPQLRRGPVAVVVLVVLTLTATLVAQPWVRQGPGASPSPGGSAGPAGASPSSSPEGAWTDVELAPLAAVATLEASRRDDAGVRPDATFALTSLTSDTGIALARRIEVTPATKLAITTGGDIDRVTLRPETALQPGTVYRFALRGQDGSLAASWAFRVRSPLHVLSTIPGNESTGVPARTGIEVTFDQEGVADIADHFSIEPVVKGRFERHGRTQVFVPDGLADKTLYTVTIKAGLSREGTDLTLEQDVVFTFETQGEQARQPWLQFGRDVVETSPTEAPILAVQAVVPGAEEEALPPPTKAEIKVYRLPSLDAAITALAGFLAAPRWTQFSEPRMAVEGLPVAATFSAKLEALGGTESSIIRFPDRLAKGWYIVEIQGTRPVQAFLQVTPVSAWVSVLTDRTVIWVNDVASGKAAKGATATIAGGAAFGTSDAEGLLIAATPDALVPPAEAGDRDVPDHPPLMVVRSSSGDAVIVPFEVGWDGEIYRGEWWEKSPSGSSTHWSILLTDRTLYRTTDTVGVWGYLRGRDDGKVPSKVELRLTSTSDSGVADPPAVASASATPNGAGAYTAALQLDRVPPGTYQLRSVVGGRTVSLRWLEVGVIRKPAYRIAITTDRHAVIARTTVRWTATATFFDGTPVPGLQVRFSAPTDEGTVVTTDAAGRATIEIKAPGAYDDQADASDWDVSVWPAVSEEGEILASAKVLVFPSAYHLEASGTVEDGQLRVTGALDAVDLAKVEAAVVAETYDDDPDGAPVKGASVRAVVTELVPVKRLVGNDYDYIEKVVRPRYEYELQRKSVKTVTVKTGTDGHLAFSLAVPDPTHQYEVKLTTPDKSGLIARRTIEAGTPAELWRFGSGVRFEAADGKEVGAEPYGVGDKVTWRMTDDGTPLPSGKGDRYLYIVAQRGLRAATITDSATFERTFEAADAPGIFIMGVRFTGSTYAPKAAAWADFDQQERDIGVTVTADRERYRPGDDLTLTVRTTDVKGRPIPASVVVQAVDEKLYAMGAAYVSDPLDALYQRVDSGIVRLTATHQVPTSAGPEGEGGDTTGGGEGRTDFRDTLVFKAVQTDASGRATLAVHLSDDLTSWHVAASALTAGLQAGVGELLVPVGLPLFADATIADEYLASDRPTIRLRAYGEGLQAGDPVEFTVSSTSLGLAPTKLTGTAFSEISLGLPALSLGSHKIDIAVVSPTRKDAAGKPLTDRLIRTFAVVRSRLTAARAQYLVLGDPLPSVAGSEAATYTFTDAGRGRYLSMLLSLADPGSARLDRGLAQSLARGLLIEAFGRDPASLAPDTFDPIRYPIENMQDEAGTVRAGLPLLPYGGSDPWLAARVAILAPEAFDVSQLREALTALRDRDSTQRDLWIACVAGLAALGDAVSADLEQARAATDLTVTEKLYLALGFEALGDDASARAIERDLLGAYAQARGPWVRLNVGDRNESAEATSLMAVVAAGLGDPLAPQLIDYVWANPSQDATHALDVAAAVGRALERTPAIAASFAYTVGGQRTVVRLEAGDTVTLTLTPEQRSTLAVERLSGQVGVAIGWRDVVNAATLQPDPALSLRRSPPSSPIPTDRLATVDLTAEFSASALESGCYEVVETVPSGLAPVALQMGIGAEDPTIVWPSSVVGQRVTFCASLSRESGSTAHLRYIARVVNAGTFTWEPAVMQLEGVPEAVAVTPAGTARIGGS